MRKTESSALEETASISWSANITDKYKCRPKKSGATSKSSPTASTMRMFFAITQ